MIIDGVGACMYAYLFRHFDSTVLEITSKLLDPYSAGGDTSRGLPQVSSQRIAFTTFHSVPLIS